MKKNFIRTISLVLALVMSFSLMTTAFAAETDVDTDSDDLVVWYDADGNIVDFETPDDAALVTSFKDVKSSAWYYKDVTEFAKLGIVAGFEDGTFKPENQVTSVQLLTMLTRTFYASKLDQVTAPKGSAWYYKNTKVAADVGMSTGMKAIDDKPINRYEMALVLGNVLAANGKTITSATRVATMSKITDYDSIPKNSGYHKPVTVCYALGIITGMSDGSFCGAQNMTRAQACTVIMRMLKLINNYNPGDKDNNQYDDGKNQNTGNTGNNQNTSTGTGKLTNGKDATVANVTAMLNTLKQQWPKGTTWDGNGSNGNYYANGGASGSDIHGLQSMTGVGLYYTTFQYGCGGFAAMISDKIFGTTGAPVREVTDIKNARPGDILVKYNKSGTPTHVSILLSVDTPYANSVKGGVNYNIYTADGNVNGTDNYNGGKITWNLNCTVWNNFGSSNYNGLD